MPVHEHQVNHLPRTRRRVIANLTTLDDSFMSDFTLCSVALAKQGGGAVSTSAMSVLMFILGRTLAFRKKAEVITSRQFESGVISKDGERISSGCGVSASTTRRALKELCEKGFIKIHTFSDGKKEQHARAYEVMAEQIKAIADLESAKSWLKREGFYGQNYAKGGVKFTPHPLEKEENVPFLGCQIYHTITDNDKSLSNRILSNDNISQPSAATREGEVIPTPRNGRKRRDLQSIAKTPARDIPSIISSRHTASTENRAAASRKVTARKWTTVELQALLDKARTNVTESGATVNRMVVVAKNIGVLHKRMLAADIPDAVELFEWVYLNWGKVANANKRAKARQTKVNQRTESAMALSPNFNDLAFRLPYILALYNDSKATEEMAEQVTAKEDAEQQQKLDNRTRVLEERRRLSEQRDRDEARRRKQEETSTRSKRVTRKVARKTHGEPEDTDMPEWGGR